jgi:tetratricopeptide (TPR) repeat protein
MNSCLVSLGTALALITTGLCQEAGGNKTTLSLLEQELLAHPCFERPFYDMMTATLDGTAWQNLDARWQKLEAVSPRFKLLRGMLAERQGDFDAALSLYESVKEDDWGAYHHGRFLAFLGRTQEAKQRLLKVVEAAKHPWLFREAARGVGEVTLLQEGVEAAEKHYATLWKEHAALKLRMTLLEPLLTLRMELGRGAGWLESMRPAFNPDAVFSPSAAELDQGIIWHWGSLLTNPQYQRGRGAVPPLLNETVLYGLSLFAGPKDDWFIAASQHSDCGRWEGPLSLEQGFHTLSKTPLVQAESLARFPQTECHAFESVLALAANGGGEAFLQTAKALESQLRERPWLAMRTVLFKTDRIHSAHDKLAREVFAGSKDPAWQFMSLILRMAAGGKPEDLRADALALWHSVKPEQRLLVREDMPPKLSSGPDKHFLEQLGGSSHPEGSWCPLSTVVWNLRGGSFNAVMRNRFAFENQKLFSLGITTRALISPPKSKDGSVYLGSLPDFETGTQMRFALWLLRDRLGLDQTNLGRVGDMGKDATNRASDVLIRGSQAEICQFLIGEPKLAELPAKWLLTLQKTIRLRHSAGGTPEVAPEVYEAAAARVADALLEQRPDWFVTSLVNQRQLMKVPVLDAGQNDDLLVSCGHMTGRSEAARITALQNWRKLVPSITDDRSLQAELERALQRLGTKALPHALWGLQWQPSLRRQVAVASPDYVSQRSSRTYLTETLPRVLNGQIKIGPGTAFMQPNADEVSFKLLQLFGPELLKPQPGRSLEIRPYMDRHPRVRDLLKAWDIMQVELPVDDPLQTFRHVHPVKQAALMKVLEDSASSADAKVTFGMLHQWHGDAKMAERLWKETNGAQGPLNMLAPLMVQRTVPPPALDFLDRARRAFAELKKPEPAKSLAWRIAKTQAERQALYEWLRKEVKPDPVFATQISVMAELARSLKLSAKEIETAEQLDLQVNKDDPMAWLRRAISLAKEGKADWAVDLFVEAVRRTDFTNPPAYLWEHSPPKPAWLERAKNAGRLGELATALRDSLRNSPPGSADDTAASILETIIKGEATSELDAQVKPLLDVVLERDRHLLLARFETLVEASKTAKKGGKADMAALLARMALRGVWPESLTQKAFRSLSGVNGVPQSVYRARTSWSEGESSEGAGSNAPIAAVFTLALQGDDAAGFIAELTKDAEQFPEDEQIISCALVAQARHGRLGGDALGLMEKLPPLARMRTAWRLCELAPVSKDVLSKLAPVLVTGLRETFQSSKHKRNGVPSYQLADKVAPWIEKAGAKAELRGLVTLFAENLNDSLWPLCWRLTAGLAAKHASAEAAQEVTIRWWEHCFRAMNRPGEPIEWFIETMEEIGVLMQDPYGPTLEPFADLAHEIWKVTMKKFSSTEDPPAKMALLLCDALVSTGRADQLKALHSDIETILQIDGDRVFGSVRDRIQQGLALLGADGSGVSVPLIWIHGREENDSGVTVTWRLVVPLKQPDDDLGELFGGSHGLSDEWVVPHFLKGVHDLELFAGNSPAALNPVAKVTVGSKAGSVRLNELPPAGWMRAVLRNASTGAVNFGKPVMYCLTKPLLDSTSLETATPPEWEEELTELYGRPISSLAPVESGMKIMITDSTRAGETPESMRIHDASLRAEIHLVGVDDAGVPIGILPFEHYLERRADGMDVVLIEPDQWSGTNGWLQMPRPGMQRSNATPAHFVMTTFAAPKEPLRCLRVQIFAKAAGEPAKLTESAALVARPVAELGFPIARWRLCEKLPRAAFVGEGVLALYDTTDTPWKELLRYHDAELGSDTSVFMTHPDTVCVTTASRELPDAAREIWQLRCDGAANPVTLRECPKVTLPFVPTQSALSPDEKSCVFVSAPVNGGMHVAWLDDRHSLKLLQIDAPGDSPRSSSSPVIAWWPDNQAAVIEHGGNLFHLRLQAGELKLERVEKGSIADKRPPQEAMPGPPALSYAWTLKRSQVLVQTDRKTNDLLGVFRLPEECMGKAMWWRIKSRPVLLQTRQHELITVMPLTTKASQ